MNTETEQKILNLYAKTRTQQPSNALDERVLNAAKNQLKQKKTLRTRRTIWAFSSVALVVLCVNVVMKISIDPELNKPLDEAIILSQELSSSDTVSNTSTPEQESPSAALAPQQDKPMNSLNDQAPSESFIAQDSSKSSPVIARSSNIENKLKKQAAPALATTMPTTELTNKTNDLSEKSVPIFKFNATELLQNRPTLHAQTQANQIDIYQQSELILSVIKLTNESLKIVAYQGSEAMDLPFNWQIKTHEINGCSSATLQQPCFLAPKFYVTFQQGKAVSYHWLQTAPATLSE